MKIQAKMITVVVPAAVDGVPGEYITKQETDFLAAGSFYMDSIDGASTIDIELHGGDRVGLHPKVVAGTTYGMENHHNASIAFDYIVFKNPATVKVTVSIRVLLFGMYYVPGTGGGGIATHVSIDGTPKVEVIKAPPVTIDIPKDLEVVIKDGTKVGLSEGATVEVSKMPKVDVTFPSTLPVTGTVGLSPGATVEVTKAPPVTVNIPKDLEVIIKDGTKVGLSDGTTVEVSKMPKVDVTFPATLPVTGTVKISDAVDIAGVVDIGGFSEDASIAIKGTVQTTIDTSKKPLDVAFDGSAIKVVPAPPPGLCAGGVPTVGKTIAKIVSARPKRSSIIIQAHHNNSGNIYLRDSATEHVICALIAPGASWSAEYTGELWANADNDNSKTQIMELYNA